MKRFILASAMLLSATSFSFAQSLTNFGPNAPSYGDSYGKRVAGTYPPLQKRAYKSYAYQPYGIIAIDIITGTGIIDIGTETGA